MNNLAAIFCPICNTQMNNNGKIEKKTNKYEDCIRKCFKCSVGYSNGKNNPTLIYKNPNDNIPPFIKKRYFLELLENSLNRRNLKNKLEKAGFATSEDALTFTFIEYFHQNNQLNKLLEILGVELSSNDINIFLWGHPISNVTNIYLIKKIKTILKNNFCENTNSYTEPDVLINIKGFGNIIIEVKYNSRNDIQKSNKIKKYIDNNFYIDINKAIACQHYELVRNWSLGNSISVGENYILINLGRKELFEDKHLKLLNKFEESLNQNIALQFMRLSWEEVISRIDKPNSKIKEYLKEKMNAR